jgi:hypothetical protein
MSFYVPEDGILHVTAVKTSNLTKLIYLCGNLVAWQQKKAINFI